jgi:acyl-coenzyme A thioesterase PaaI-like protein
MDLDIDRTHREVMRYFGVSQREIGDWEHGELVMEGIAPVAPHLAGPHGGVRSGALLAMADHVGGLCGGLASLPDGWVVSTNLTLRVASLEHRGPLRFHADVLRRGRSAVVNRVRVHDDGADARVVADAVLTSAVLVPETGPPRWERPVALAPDRVDGAEPAAAWLRTRPRGDGTLVLDLRDGLRNPWGILHGAVVGVLVDLAAEEAVRVATGTTGVTTDIALHYLAPGRVGPVTARGEIVGRRADGHVVRVELRDTGASDRVVSVAVTTVRPFASV